MAHVRQQIRDAAVTLLTGLATSGANVFASRDALAYPLAESELPALLVDVLDERVIQTGFGGATSACVCECDLRVRMLVKSTTGYADTLDDMAVEVQSTLVDAGKVAGVSIARYAGTTGPAFDGSADRPVALLSMTMVMVYVINANDPETAL